MLSDLFTPAGYALPEPTPTDAVSAGTIDEIVSDKRRIIRTKLEVVASEIFERLRIRTKNLAAIERDEETLYAMLATLDRSARYHLRDQGDKRILYELLFTAKQERRSQDAECWRDIVLVMRDLLEVWDAHELAKSRSKLFTDAGR